MCLSLTLILGAVYSTGGFPGIRDKNPSLRGRDSVKAALREYLTRSHLSYKCFASSAYLPEFTQNPSRQSRVVQRSVLMVNTTVYASAEHQHLVVTTIIISTREIQGCIVENLFRHNKKK